MKKIFKLASVVVTFASLNACGAQNESSKTSGWFSRPSKADTQEATPIKAITAPREINFNLFGYLQATNNPLIKIDNKIEEAQRSLSKPEFPESLASATPVSATPVSATPVSATPVSATPVSATPVSATPVSATPVSTRPFSAMNAIGFGDKNLMRVENNLIVNASEADRKASALYFIDSYFAGIKVGQGSALDITANASLRTFASELTFRINGQDKYKGKLDAVYDQSFTRDFASPSINVPVPAFPMLGLQAHGTVGGEIGLSASSGTGDSLKSIQLRFEPRVDLMGTLAGGLNVLHFAKAEAIGNVSLMKTTVPLSTEIGLSDEDLVYSNMKLSTFSVDALNGKIDLIASAGLSNILPETLPAAWKQIVTNVFGKTYDYKATLWTAPGIKGAVIDEKKLSF